MAVTNTHLSCKSSYEVVTLVFNKFFLPIVDTCLSCKDIAQQSSVMVLRWRIFGNFLGPAFPASCVHHISDLHSKFALGHTMCRSMVDIQSATAEISWGKKKKKKIEEPHHNRFTPFFWDHPGQPVPEENFWTLWRKGRLSEADTPTIQMGATPSALSSATSTIPHFLQAGCPSCRPTNSVKALKATSAFGLGRRR